MNIDSFNGIVIDGEQRFTETVSFGDVQINGNAEFTENMEAVRIDISGYGLFRNFTTCDRLIIGGRADFRRKVLAESVRNTGECTVYGKLTSDVLVNSGNMQLSGASSLGRVVIKKEGYFASSAKVRTDRLTVHGRISVVGEIRSEAVEIFSSESSYIDSVYAEELKVRREPGLVSETAWDIEERKYVLTASEVDVFDADIEHVYIDQLCCDSANIGPGCYIRELMYRDRITVSSDSFAERLIKV